MFDGDVRDLPAVGMNLPHRGVVLKHHAELREVRHPWVDPHLVGRARQHRIDIHAVCHQPEAKLEPDRTDGARAAFLGADGDHQTREALAQELD